MNVIGKRLSRKHLVFVWLAVVALVLALAPPAAADPGKQKYILALGDSETAGTQAVAQAVVLGGSPETEVNRSGAGYADQLAARLESRGLRADLVNLACYYE